MGDRLPTFMDEFHAGRATAQDIDAHIQAWHADPDTRASLHVTLGLTWRQYRRWAETGQLPAVTGPAVPAGRVELNTRRVWADIDLERTRRGLSRRAVSREANHRSASTLDRLQSGNRISVDELANLLLWLGDTDLAPYLNEEGRN